MQVRLGRVGKGGRDTTYTPFCGPGMIPSTVCHCRDTLLACSSLDGEQREAWMPGSLDGSDWIGLDRGAACSVATPPICLECSTYSLFTHPGSTEGLPGSLYIICYLTLRASDLDLGEFSLVVSDALFFLLFFFPVFFFALFPFSPVFLSPEHILPTFSLPLRRFLLNFCECSLLTWSRSVGDSCPLSAISVPYKSQGLGVTPRHTS